MAVKLWEIFDHVEWEWGTEREVRIKAEDFAAKGWYIFFAPKQHPELGRWVCGATKDEDALQKYVNYHGDIEGED